MKTPSYAKTARIRARATYILRCTVLVVVHVTINQKKKLNQSHSLQGLWFFHIEYMSYSED